MAATMSPGPHEVFEQMRRQWLAGDGVPGADLMADDVVVELPFASPGRPSRFEGREQFLAYAGPLQAVFPVRFDDVRDVVLHDTGDPEVIVVEYELAGTVTHTGHRAAAPFIGVLRVRDGKIAQWREYQNVPAIAAAVQGPATAGTDDTSSAG
jgi:uncharacterized protein